MNALECFRRGFAPELSDAALRGLRDACATADERLIQGRTASPTFYQSEGPEPICAGCAIGFALMADGLATNEEVEEGFGRLCQAAEQRLNELAGCRWFLNFWDETDLAEARLALREEIERILEERKVAV